MRRFVLDASVALAWFVDSPVDPVALRVQQHLLAGDRAIVPHLWRFEMANGFLVAQRRGILTGAHIAQSFSDLDRLIARSVESFDRNLPLKQIVSAGQQFGLTAYDATYLETSRELDVPLATLDQRLVTAAGQAGVSLIT